MVRGLKVSSLACKRVLSRPENNAKETTWNRILKVLECKNETCQRIELKEKMKKWGNLSSYHVYPRSYGY